MKMTAKFIGPITLGDANYILFHKRINLKTYVINIRRCELNYNSQTYKFIYWENSNPTT